MLKPEIKIFSTIIFSVLFGFETLAQTKYFQAEQYTIENGLSQNTINSIFQSPDGYLLFGTQDGLNFYDGYEFISMRHAPHDSSSVSGNFIRHIEAVNDSILVLTTQTGINLFNIKTRQFSRISSISNVNKITDENDFYFSLKDNSHIWFRSLSGLTKYNLKNKKHTRYSYEKDEFSHVSDYNYFSLIQDNKGLLWTGSAEGLCCFDPESEKFTIYKPEISRNPKYNEVFYTLSDSKNTLWIAGYSGLMKFNRTNKKFTRIPILSVINQEVEVNILSLFEDKSGTIWAGTENGPAIYDLERNRLIMCSLTDLRGRVLQTGRIVSIFQDRSGIIWMGAHNGIFKINPDSKIFKHYHLDKSLNRAYSVFLENDTLLWVGTRHEGINLFNRYSGENINFSSFSKNYLPDNQVHCILRDRTGNIIIGTSNGAFVFDKKKRKFVDFSVFANKDFSAYFTKNRISAIIHDQKGQYWFSTYNGLIRFDNRNIFIYKSRINQTHDIPSNQITHIIETRNGDIWLTTLNGVARYNPESDNFTVFTKEKNSLSNNSSLCIVETSDKKIWIGTETGLNRYDAKNNIFEYFTEKDGFKNDYIYSVLEDNYGNLWVGTNKGISKFDPREVKVTNYNNEDGLAELEFNIGAAFKSKRGELFFGGISGVTSVSPDVKPINSYIPQASITKFILINSFGNVPVTVSGTNEVRLKSNERTFTVEFAILEFSSPNKNEFKYKIPELDTSWVNLGTRHSASFSQLQPGKYTLLIQGCNSSGVWQDEPTVLKIHIAVPFWRTKLAYFLYFFVIVLFITYSILSYNKTIRKENKRLQEKEKASKKIEEQKEELAVKNQNISDSIHYAKRIIDAMMPTEKYFKRLLPESFVLYLPKDIVSGDFFWIHESEDKIFVATGDCTGHGVPGAFMSIIGMDLLRNIIGLGIQTPAEILNKLNRDVSLIFKPDPNEESTLKDGMDITICSICKTKKQIEFAGAINPMYLIREENIVEYKGDRFYVGPSGNDSELRHFVNHTIDLLPNDIVYFFSDGFADQFGGAQGKKFKYRRFRHLLLTIHKYDFSQQKELLKSALMKWKEKTEQVDDILVIGIKPLAGKVQEKSRKEEYIVDF